MPAKGKVQVTFHISPAECEVLNHLAKGNRSAYLRHLIRRDARMQNVEWPDETRDTRGQYLRKPKE